MRCCVEGVTFRTGLLLLLLLLLPCAHVQFVVFDVNRQRKDRAWWFDNCRAQGMLCRFSQAL